MEQNKNFIGYKFDHREGQVVITLKSGVQVKTAPEPLEAVSYTHLTLPTNREV